VFGSGLVITIHYLIICQACYTIDLLHNYVQTALWPTDLHQPVLSMLSYDRLSKKPLLFKSFTGLLVEEFDNIYDREITKRYERYQMQRLSQRKIDRKIDIGAGRPFKLDLEKSSHAFSVLSSLHNLHFVGWFFI
jgi:hypothetical protein